MISMTKSEGTVSDQDEKIKALNCTDVPRNHWLVKKEDGKNWIVALNVNLLDNTPAMHIRNDRLFLGVEQGIFVQNSHCR